MPRQNVQHHKIPRVYLQNFTDNKGMVWIADNKLIVRPQKPTETLTERDYYTVHFPNGKGTLTIETKYLNGIESTFGVVYAEKIAPRLPLTTEEKAKMAIFVASMLQRVPNRRKAIDKFSEDLKRLTSHMKLLSPEKRATLANIASPSDKENAIPADDLIKALENTGSVHSELMPNIVSETAPIIFSMNFDFIEAPNDCLFLTSDDPCKLVNPELEIKFGIGKIGSAAGLQQEGVELTLPLSSRICLLAGWELQKDLAYIKGTKEIVMGINSRTKRYAQNLICSSKDDAETAVQKVKDYKNKLTN